MLPPPETANDPRRELRLETRRFEDRKTLSVPLPTGEVEAELARLGWTAKDVIEEFKRRQWVTRGYVDFDGAGVRLDLEDVDDEQVIVVDDTEIDGMLAALT